MLRTSFEQDKKARNVTECFLFTDITQAKQGHSALYTQRIQYTSNSRSPFTQNLIAMETTDNEHVLRVAEGAAKKAGEKMLAGFVISKKVDIKSAYYDVVTEYDKAVEEIIFSELKKSFPTHRFIGEESAQGPNDHEITDEPTWIVDPIDGTCNYIHGFSESAISIGFAVDREVKVGVIYNPITQQLFSASKGRGAFQNGIKIKVSNCTEHSKSLLATEVSFACIPQCENKVIERFRGLVCGAHGHRSIGCAALTLCYVANGTLDGYVQDDLSCWDVAAGVIIIREAGGIVLQSNGEPFDLGVKKILAASTQSLANKLVTLIKAADERAQLKV